MQTAIVIVIIALSVAYAVWRVYRFLQTSAEDPCAGCQGCALKELKRQKGENKHCTEKKYRKNLAK